MKISKPTLIPSLLLIYLAVMSYIGYGAYSRGEFSAIYYFGTIIGTILVITLLHFSLKRREKLRKEREHDLKNETDKNKSK